MSRPVLSLLRRRFGRLKVTAYAGARNNHAYWACQCDCGGKVEARSDHLLTGRVVSCGCQREDSRVRSKARMKIPARVRRRLGREAIAARWKAKE